ncbi:hypothetical protein EIP86_005443 [Pleurotus ostreatoroseus]|nr:hypothetical protein EIP86_005443 [Pleurotus ostreatoroseus]
MSRIPPGLLYLTIYNPTLSPDTPAPDDDEDAEEQAHILFYTAREQAVSRDKILRQVGLAKALVNFSEVFSLVDDGIDVHSQSRRMIMVSPEPDFWIHASKGKAKAKDAPTQPESTYDYHDGSIYDLALKTQILRGYDQFKLTHGTFSSVLETLGQQALELQMERFFTVWAWKWDLEDDLDFCDHLGVPLHPSHRSLTLILDNFAQEHLPSNAVSFALIPPNVAPSSTLFSSKYPDAFLRHVLSKIPTPNVSLANKAITASLTADKSLVHAQDPLPSNDTDSKAPGRPKSVTNPFLNVDMPNLKWMWTGLTFGKTSSTKSTALHTPAEHPSTPEPEPPSKETTPDTPAIKVDDLGDPTEATGLSTEIDTESLREAISSENVHSPASHASSVSLPPLSPPMRRSPSLEDTTIKELDTNNEEAEVDQADLDDVAPSEEIVESPSEHTESDKPLEYAEEVKEPSLEPRPSRTQAPAFLNFSVHLSSPDTAWETKRKRVYHAASDSITFAFVISQDDELDLPSIAEHTIELFEDMRRCVDEHVVNNTSEHVLPTVTSILEKQSEHIASMPPFTCSYPSFHSNSEHLFRGQELLHSDLDISEVFSRGQNPQHWHISRSGLGTKPTGEQIRGEVYLEVERKESTLTDVDNELAGIVKKFAT